MNIDLNNTIRSAVIALVGLPITAAIAATAFVDATPSDMKAVARVKGDLTEACVDYMVSKADSKLERQSQDEIDTVLGADGANYKELCGWVL